MYLREAAAFPSKRKVVPLARVLHYDSKVVFGDRQWFSQRNIVPRGYPA